MRRTWASATAACAGDPACDSSSAAVAASAPGSVLPAMAWPQTWSAREGHHDAWNATTQTSGLRCHCSSEDPLSLHNAPSLTSSSCTTSPPLPRPWESSVAAQHQHEVSEKCPSRRTLRSHREVLARPRQSWTSRHPSHASCETPPEAEAMRHPEALAEGKTQVAAPR